MEHSNYKTGRKDHEAQDEGMITNSRRLAGSTRDVAITSWPPNSAVHLVHLEFEGLLLERDCKLLQHSLDIAAQRMDARTR